MDVHRGAIRRSPFVRMSKRFCRRLQFVPMAPSVKTFTATDRGEPPNSPAKVALSPLFFRAGHGFRALENYARPGEGLSKQ